MSRTYVGVRKVEGDELWHAIIDNDRHGGSKIDCDRVTADEARKIVDELFQASSEAASPLDEFKQHLRNEHRLKHAVDYSLLLKYNSVVITLGRDIWQELVDEHVWIIMQKREGFDRIDEVHVISVSGRVQETHARLS
jgi:hypothetical protein